MLAWISCASSRPAARCSPRSAFSSPSARRTASRTSTPVFAVERVDVRGAPPELAREVTAATRDLVGQSLVAIDADEVEGTLRALPAVAGVSVDRAFPHTLVVKVAPERPVAVVRRGDSSWLVTGAGQGHSRDRDRDRAAASAPLAREGHDDPSRRDRSRRLGAGDASARRGALGRPRLARQGHPPGRGRAHARPASRDGDPAWAGDRGRAQAHRRGEGAAPRRRAARHTST